MGVVQWRRGVGGGTDLEEAGGLGCLLAGVHEDEHLVLACGLQDLKRSRVWKGLRGEQEKSGGEGEGAGGGVG